MVFLLSCKDNKQFPSQEGIPILASILLSVPISRSSTSPSSTNPLPSLSELAISTSNDVSDEDEDSHLDTCIELLSISAALLEGLALDHDIHKQTISLTSYDSTSPSPSLLYRLLEFVEFASPPSDWTRSEEETKRLAKTFEVVKAATVRAVVEGMNDDKVMHELWKLDGEAKGGNWLIEKLVCWLDEESQDGKREDLMVCASHMLAGLGRSGKVVLVHFRLTAYRLTLSCSSRSDQYVERLVHDYGLAEPLAKIIKTRVPIALVPPASSTPNQEQGKGRAGENTQILYGVVSLMRHLAIPRKPLYLFNDMLTVRVRLTDSLPQAVKNRPIVSSTRIIPTISKLLKPSLDIVKPLQMSVVGLLKHLTRLNGESFFSIFQSLLANNSG
jgi:hypothetical protein